MTILYGSGSADPCLSIMDPDPAVFVIDHQVPTKNCFFLFEGTLTTFTVHHFSKIKSKKKSQNNRDQGFAYYFCLMIKGSGSVTLTNGSGSKRPKNIRIRRFRIRNTGFDIRVQSCVSDPAMISICGRICLFSSLGLRTQGTKIIWIRALFGHAHYSRLK
jgi:hypothetical protein